MLRFNCILIRNFPAWALERQDPTLAGRAVVVHARRRVVAVSPAARRAGVQAGWLLERALALAPEAVARPHQAGLTEAAWEEAMRTLYGWTPWLESLRPGLALAQAPDEAGLVPLLRELGAGGGAAGDRTTAELAAHSAEPGELRSVPTNGSAAFLNSLPCSLLIEMSVSEATCERLQWLGWNCIGQLRRVTRRQLEAQFPEGELLFRLAQGHHRTPLALWCEPPAVERHFCFDEAAREPAEVEPVLEMLLQGVLEELEGRTVQALTVAIDAGCRRITCRRLAREPLASLHKLRHAAQAALQELMAPAPWVDRLELRLGALARPRAVQGHLFAPTRPAHQPVIQAVEKRFPGSMLKIVTVYPQAYLPEEAFRLEPV